MSYSFGRRTDDREAPPLRALIADDEESFREYMRVLLLRVGIDAVPAADGSEALERLRSGHFDLLIADYEMPRMSGLDLIAAVRTDPSLAALYAVMLTGHDDLALKVAALSGGFDDFLAKACSEVEVAAKVVAAQRMLTRQRALDSAAREWYGIAIRDELTGVFSRRFFFDEASRLLSEQRQVNIVMFDLDDFKLVNDHFGHVMGDRVLRDIGRLFLQRTRAGDVIARYGGDEFALLVIGAPLYEVYTAADRLARNVSELRWVVEDGTLTIGASHGVASSALIPNATIEQIIETADRDLYASKWVRKNPGVVRPELYDYPARERSAVVTPISGGSSDAEGSAPESGHPVQGAPASAGALAGGEAHRERPSDRPRLPGQAADQPNR